MNMQNLDILLELQKNKYISQRALADASGYSLGKVNKSLKVLLEQGYINEDMQITLKAKKEFEQNKPSNAIILAAGFGMRMVPINTEVPKGLLEINGQSLIERIIEQLWQVGITDITIVVGFLKEHYEYLIDKYNVKFVVNMDYVSKNNLYSLAKVADSIENTYIIPCDIYCKENPFSNTEIYSWYMISDEYSEESSVRVNRKNELVKVKGEKSGNRMLGISYITQKQSEIVVNRLVEYSNNARYDNSFWEEVLYDNDKMIVSAKLVSSTENFEINTFEQLREVDESSSQLQSEIIALIAEVFHTCEGAIKDITVLKKGMTNRSFQFSYNGERFIMRIPGEGTEQLINRKEEYCVYQTIQKLGLCDDIYYINPDNGYKITKYIEDARTCNDTDWNDIKKCMMVLKSFHDKKLTVEHTFHLFGQIEFYESLWEEKSCYRDYQVTKADVFKMKSFIDSLDKDWALTHIDANADNFLISTDSLGNERINLIDWEYAAMQDPHLDIAMFAIYSMYDREQIDRLIDCYFEEKCSDTNRLKIYAYIAAGGLLWSNWCEYKRQKGQEFGEYSIKQYRYAKEYSRIVINELTEEKE
ncbi:MAG: NTP transferase domain-containing protein [Eubacterium sp.]